MHELRQCRQRASAGAVVPSRQYIEAHRLHQITALCRRIRVTRTSRDRQPELVLMRAPYVRLLERVRTGYWSGCNVKPFWILALKKAAIGDGLLSSVRNGEAGRPALL